MRSATLAMLAALVALAPQLFAAEPTPLGPGPRRPIAVQLVDSGQRVLVANRNGLVTLVDLKEQQVQAEWKVGRRLVDLTSLPEGRRFLALDEETNEAIRLDYADGKLSVRERFALPARPATVVVAHDGRHAYVTLLWSRELCELDLAQPTLKITRRAPLPFPPRLQLELPDGRHWLVLDAFGGQLALIDRVTLKVLHAFDSGDHNLAGVCLTPDRAGVAISGQNLSSEAPTTTDAIDGNRFINNQVRRFTLEELLAKPTAEPRREEYYRLGFAGSGAADPAGLFYLNEDELCVALAGTHELCFVRTEYKTLRHVNVGRRPIRALPLPDGRVLTVNMFGDSLSIVDPKEERDTLLLPLGPPGETHPRDRGEMLFYDGELSRDGWMSCHSCHTDGHSNGRLADTLGDDTHGTPKRVLSLLATADTGPWGWLGNQRDVFDQIEKSVTATMHGSPISRAKSADIASFMYTLKGPPTRQPATKDPADRELLERGKKVFVTRGCAQCHVPPLTYTQLEAFDVGMPDELGQRKFNPPTLVGVGQRDRLFHDNRGTSLEDLFERHGHRLGNEPLKKEELEALTRFLRSL